MITENMSPPGSISRDDLTRRVRRADRWSLGGGLLAGVGALTCLVAGLNGHGTTASDESPTLSLTMTLPPAHVSLLLAAAGAMVCAGLLALRGLTRAVGRGTAATGHTPWRTAAVVAVPFVAVVALATVCDANPLAFLGYLPMVLVGSLFSPEMREVLVSVAWPQMLAELVVAGTAVVAVLAALRVQDALRGRNERPRWQQPAAATRWGRTAVAIATAVPLLYAATRILWALGVPVGFDADAYADSGGDVNNGLVLAGGAIVGSLLTIGLVRPWGERFWPWLPLLGGRGVPVALAVVPAAAVAALILPAGVSMIVAAVNHLGVASIGSLAQNWAAIGVTFLWPIWSIALAMATWAYALRRRP